ncbi:SDR family NAD(P)-dependent oxidoreductase [Mycolicibacterium lutetiense]|uniref:NAD(P)-dependent dehydrogenase (Short-subunit alcohol dehydrogenase family) n=1 Tax=Mycolicibacterium lutetiense TaxID=1641992 RepID=A0ABS4ZUD2_9MYCO|nr:SDR family oxidoreductase [Mycolicibacterium lutetiense]MBP2453108.1 NAD(P)-dependent dehydrogenase (short-subunit alcohol dehydrogenase family) [Mycolicibacterium lutetiense]
MTGAARGQGAAIVRRLVADGYRVTAADLLIDEIKSSAAEFGDQVLGVELDVTSAEQWQAAVQATVDRFGGLNALVNNAGVLHRASISEETPAGFESAWRVNCLGPFLGLQAALEPLRQAEGAAVVNTCSTGAVRPFPHHAAYGSSKWALRGLTQLAAAELGRDGIRVNAVFPGPIETPMLDESTQARLIDRATLGRLGKPSEIADAVAFLLSGQAAFITGSELLVDGGQCLQIG